MFVTAQLTLNDHHYDVELINQSSTSPQIRMVTTDIPCLLMHNYLC